jgi:hypothetical protein
MEDRLLTAMFWTMLVGAILALAIALALGTK